MCWADIARKTACLLVSTELDQPISRIAIDVDLWRSVDARCKKWNRWHRFFWRFVATKWPLASVTVEYVTAFWRHNAEAIRFGSHYGFMANHQPEQRCQSKRERPSVRRSLFSFLRPRRCSFDRISIIIYVWRWPDMWMSKYNKHAACCRSYSSGAKCKHVRAKCRAHTYFIGPFSMRCLPRDHTLYCSCIHRRSASSSSFVASKRASERLSVHDVREPTIFFSFCLLRIRNKNIICKKRATTTQINRTRKYTRSRARPGQTPPTNVLRNSTDWIYIYMVIQRLTF